MSEHSHIDASRQTAAVPLQRDDGEISFRPVLILGLVLAGCIAIGVAAALLDFNFLSAQAKQDKQSEFPLAVQERARTTGRSYPAEIPLEGIDPLDLTKDRSGVPGWPALAPRQAKLDEEKFKAASIPIERAIDMVIEQENRKTKEAARPGAKK